MGQASKTKKRNKEKKTGSNENLCLIWSLTTKQQKEKHLQDIYKSMYLLTTENDKKILVLFLKLRLR